MLRDSIHGLAGRNYGFRKIMVDVCIHAGQSELNAGDCGLVSPLEHRIPASRAVSAGETNMKRTEIKVCELHIQVCKPSGIGEPASVDAVFHGLGHSQV